MVFRHNYSVLQELFKADGTFSWLPGPDRPQAPTGQPASSSSTPSDDICA